MFKVIFGLLLPLTMSPSVSPHKETVKEEVYFPTKVGTKWVYSDGKVEEVDVLISIEDHAGSKRVAVGGGSGIPREIYTISDKGISLDCCLIGELAEPLWILKQPHHDGNTWQAIIDLPGRVNLKGTVVANGPERVEVPAGVFQAIRVTVTFPHGIGDEKPQKKVLWYAPNVGKVKEVDGDCVEVLKSFTPGKG
jgi:hypothetical protein